MLRWWGARPAPEEILDIGANRGTWAAAATTLWPSAKITMIEANPLWATALSKSGSPFGITVLVDKKEEIQMT